MVFLPCSVRFDAQARTSFLAHDPTWGEGASHATDPQFKLAAAELFQSLLVGIDPATIDIAGAGLSVDNSGSIAGGTGGTDGQASANFLANTGTGAISGGVNVQGGSFSAGSCPCRSCRPRCLQAGSARQYSPSRWPRGR
jgi:hypothetical protein